MLKYLKEYRFYIILFMFVLIPITAIDTSNRNSRDYRFYDRVIVAITAPIQAVITWSLDGVVSVYQNYIHLWTARRQNLELLEENQKLLNTIVNLKETQEENTRLRKLLDFKEEFLLQTTVARVIAKDVSTEYRAVRINRGEKHGLQRNMAVINSEGVVGRILRVTGSTADVVTILDSLSAVDAIVKRSRVRGIVEGLTDDLCQLKFALRTDDIRPGDLLISSGLGGIFPKGVPVGTVSDVNRLPFGVTQTITVHPSVDFSKLEEVLVVTSGHNAPIHMSQDNLLGTQHLPAAAKKTPPTNQEENE